MRRFDNVLETEHIVKLASTLPDCWVAKKLRIDIYDEDVVQGKGLGLGNFYLVNNDNDETKKQLHIKNMLIKRNKLKKINKINYFFKRCMGLFLITNFSMIVNI